MSLCIGRLSGLAPGGGNTAVQTPPSAAGAFEALSKLVKCPAPRRAPNVVLRRPSRLSRGGGAAAAADAAADGAATAAASGSHRAATTARLGVAGGRGVNGVSSHVPTGADRRGWRGGWPLRPPPPPPRRTGS